MDREFIERKKLQLEKESLYFYNEMQKEFNHITNKYPELSEAIERAKKKLEIGSYNVFEVCLSLLKFKLKRKGYDFNFRSCDQYLSKMQKMEYIDRLEDSEKIKLCGDIIITDPCYIIKKNQNEVKRPAQPEHSMFGITENEFLQYIYKGIESSKIKDYQSKIDEWFEQYGTDWEKSNGGYDLEILGFHSFLSRDTLYGDWSCTTYDRDNKNILGHFCADAGMVGVFLLDEVLKYNPDFKYKDAWAVTVIRGFKGDVQIVVEEETGVYEEDSEFHKKGDTWTDYEVRLVGTGNINFITSQTGL